MPRVSNPNLQMLEVAVDSLGALVDEVRQAEVELRAMLADCFKKLLNNYRFVDAVYGHMPTDEVSQARVPTWSQTHGGECGIAGR